MICWNNSCVVKETWQSLYNEKPHWTKVNKKEIILINER